MMHENFLLQSFDQHYALLKSCIMFLFHFSDFISAPDPSKFSLDIRNFDELVVSILNYQYPS